MFFLQRRLLTPKLNSSLIPRDNETYYSTKQSKQNTESKIETNNSNSQPLRPITQNLVNQFTQVSKKIVKKPITVRPELYWHKQSVTMKMRNTNLKTKKRMIQGQLVKFKKGSSIYAFRCIKDQPKLRQMKPLTQDHDNPTDDEQIFVACKKMFLSLCEGLQNELFSPNDYDIHDLDL